MSFTVEDAKFVSNTRLLIVQNMKDGLAPEHGIDKEKLRSALETIRKDRTLGDTTGSKAKAKAPTIPIDLGEFMKK